MRGTKATSSQLGSAGTLLIPPLFLKTNNKGAIIMAYTFSTVTASNGVKLYAIKTSPKEVYIKWIGPSSVPAQSTYGVNGGFFEGSRLLQIAVNNGNTVAPTGQGTGGSENVSHARGTLVWDAKYEELSVQVVKTTSELALGNRNSYWAQGGISLKLSSSESVWRTQANKENIQNPDGGACRTAAVYNNTKNLWLVVTDTKTTAAKFRAAILEKIGSGTLVDGIMLDGSGSSQYKVAEGSYSGSDSTPRPVYQMMALR